MKVGITGGAGFIGTNLSRRLRDQGHQVTVLDDLSTGLRSNLDGLDVNFIEGSITDRATVENFVDQVDKVVHLGARGSVPRSIKNPRATHAVNTLGTFEILEAARVGKKSVIYSSSSSVYGANPTLPKKEDQWVLPITPYAASKLAAEGFASAYNSSFGMNVLTFRFFNVFGPWQRPDHDYAAVIPKWIWAAMNDREIEVHGDGEQTRDFTSVFTVLDVIETALMEDVRSLGPVNLAFGNRISLNQVLKEMSKTFPNMKVKNVGDRPGDVRNSQNEAGYLKELFPHVVPTPFEQALNETISWLGTQAHRIIDGPPVLD
jgi:UDP-glucose 4-epimerase